MKLIDCIEKSLMKKGELNVERSKKKMIEGKMKEGKKKRWKEGCARKKKEGIMIARKKKNKKNLLL